MSLLSCATFLRHSRFGCVGSNIFAGFYRVRFARFAQHTVRWRDGGPNGWQPRRHVCNKPGRVEEFHNSFSLFSLFMAWGIFLARDDRDKEVLWQTYFSQMNPTGWYLNMVSYRKLILIKWNICKCWPGHYYWSSGTLSYSPQLTGLTQMTTMLVSLRCGFSVTW